MPKPKDEQKLAAIHLQTMRLVNTTGFAALKMADVAQAAGIATGTLYVYYKSKEALINAVYLNTKLEIIDVLLDNAHANPDYFLTFKNMWTAYMQYCMQYPEKMLFVEQFIYSGLIAEEVIAQTEAKLIPLNQFLTYGQQKGLIKRMDIELIKAQMQGAITETIKFLTKQQQTLTAVQLNDCFAMTWDALRR
ncbi:MAG: TetR/AcrR family transcriptional regulator [Bacteroidia bacterium]|jgi:AcrR family transcriptional regulator|nr:TetR/AcrR family transcriptional regulator [Bacteroidia bacterium]